MNLYLKTTLQVMGVVIYIAVLIAVYVLLPLAAISILLVTAGIGVYYALKIKEKTGKEIPDEVLSDLQYVERRWEECGGTISPHTLLWEVARHKHRQNRTAYEEERRTGVPIVYGEHVRRPDIQNNVTQRVESHSTSSGGGKGNYRKSIFSRRT